MMPGIEPQREQSKEKCWVGQKDHFLCSHKKGKEAAQVLGGAEEQRQTQAGLGR